MRSADAVVVGGGLVGCAVGRALALRGVRTVVVERGGAGREASAAAAGFVSPQSDFAADGPLFRLGLASRAAYPRWVAALRRESGIDPALRRRGVLWAALSAREARALARQAVWQRGLGLRAERLSPRAARELVAGLGPGVRDALYFADDLSVDNERLVVAAAIAARRAGVALVEGIAVRGITTHRGRATGVRTERGTIAAPIVVNAAGAWAAAVAVPPGVLRPAVVPVRGQMVVLRGLPLARPLHGTDGYLAPRPDGRVLVGSTYERAGFAAQPTAGGVRALLTMAERLVPAVAGASVVGAYAGLRPGNPDGLPLVGAAPGAAGVWYACGLYRNGILLAPAVAAALADLLTTGETAWPVAALAPARLVSRRTTPRGPGRPRRDLRRS